MECTRRPPTPQFGQYLQFPSAFQENQDTHLPHLDLGRSLLGEAGEELDQPVGELQVLVVQRSEQALKYHVQSSNVQRLKNLSADFLKSYSFIISHPMDHDEDHVDDAPEEQEIDR